MLVKVSKNVHNVLGNKHEFTEDWFWREELQRYAMYSVGKGKYFILPITKLSFIDWNSYNKI